MNLLIAKLPRRRCSHIWYVGSGHVYLGPLGVYLAHSTLIRLEHLQCVLQLIIKLYEPTLFCLCKECDLET